MNTLATLRINIQENHTRSSNSNNFNDYSEIEFVYYVVIVSLFEGENTAEFVKNDLNST